MAKNNNLGDFLADIANAIREKKGMSGSINAQNFASEIASIEVGGVGGDSSLKPSIPVVGDGKTYVYMKIATKGRNNVTLYFSQTATNGLSINWGDGSVSETLSGTGNKTIAHIYENIGDYIICLTPISGTFNLGYSSYTLLGNTKNVTWVYLNMLQGIEIGNSISSISSNVFTNCFSLKVIEISQNVTNIASNAFTNCYSLSSVTIPSSVTSIGSQAFINCSSLSSITIPSGVTSIGSQAFMNCSSLSSITIPSGVKTIENNTFSGCSSLSSVTIPSSVTSIGSQAFSGCYGVVLYDFRANTSVPTLSSTNAFTNIPSDCKIVVPDTLCDSWKTATNWSTYASKIVKASEFNG